MSACTSLRSKKIGITLHILVLKVYQLQTAFVLNGDLVSFLSFSKPTAKKVLKMPALSCLHDIADDHVLICLLRKQNSSKTNLCPKLSSNSSMGL